MKDVINRMLERPFASAMLIGAITNGVAHVINAIRSKNDAT